MVKIHFNHETAKHIFYTTHLARADFQKAYVFINFYQYLG